MSKRVVTSQEDLLREMTFLIRDLLEEVVWIEDYRFIRGPGGVTVSPTDRVPSWMWTKPDPHLWRRAVRLQAQAEEAVAS